MERSEAMAALPEVYRVALELRDEGVDAAGIAARLLIDPHGIDALLAIGEQKLARLLAVASDGPGGQTPPAAVPLEPPPGPDQAAV